MASVLGKMLTIDIRVRPAPTSSIVTRNSLVGISVFGEPSSLAKPSRTARECGGSTSWTSQYACGWSPSGPVMWYSTRPPGLQVVLREGGGVGRRAPPALELARVRPQLPHAFG